MDLQTKERHLQELRQELQQKQQMITDAQQTQATLQREYENRERLLQQQLQDQALTKVWLVQFGGWRDGFINYKLNDSTVIELSK